MDQEPFAIGIDCGGTKIEVASVTTNGKLLYSEKIQTDISGGFSAVLEQMHFLIEKLIVLSPKNSFKGIGVGIAAQVDSQTEQILFAPNLKWKNVNLKEGLEKKWKVPVKIINDVRAITWGEFLFGAGKNSRDMFCMFVGTGIGGGMVSDYQLIKGSTNCFGEVGHIVIERDGEPCTCGGIGCLEAYAGGWAITQFAQQQVQLDPKGGEYLLHLVAYEVEKLTPKEVFEAADKGDPLALKIKRRITKALIAGCTTVVNLLNPSLIVFGGGILDGAPDLIAEIEQGILKHSLKAATQSLHVKRALLGKDAGTIGAASLILQNKERGFYD